MAFMNILNSFYYSPIHSLPTMIERSSGHGYKSFY
jgi:hypothetical protein